MGLMDEVTYTVKRAGPSTEVLFEDVPGPITEFDIQATGFQELSGSERQDLAEGYYKRHVVKLYSKDANLFINDLAARTNGDVVVIGGRDFEVIKKFDWTQPPSPTGHYKYWLAELEDDE